MSTETSLMGEIDTEDSILDYVHQKRKFIVDELTKSGVSSDPEMIKITLSALKDMDSQALGKKRIKADERTGDNQAAAAALIAQILIATKSNNPTNTYIDINSVSRCLPDSVPMPVIVDGETSLEQSRQSYEEFMNTMSTD